MVEFSHPLSLLQITDSQEYACIYNIMSRNERGREIKAQQNQIDTKYLLKHPRINSNSNLDDFRWRKKSKFPSILQSRNIIMQHLQPEQPNRIHELAKDIDNRRQFLTQIIKTEAQTQQVSRLQKSIATLLIPRLGKLVIDKQNPRRPRREYLASYSASQLHRYQQVHKIKEVNIQNYQFSPVSNRDSNLAENIQRRNQNQLRKMTRKMKIRYKASDYDAIRSFTTNISIVSRQKKLVGLSSLCSLEPCFLSISRLDPITPSKIQKLKCGSGIMKVNEDKIKSNYKAKDIGRIRLSFQELMKKREYIRSMQRLQPWSQQDSSNRLPYSQVHEN